MSLTACSPRAPNFACTCALTMPTAHPPTTDGRLLNVIGSTLAQLLKRPELTIEDFASVLRPLKPEFFGRDDADESIRNAQVRNELKAVETEIKYAGYLDQQRK